MLHGLKKLNELTRHLTVAAEQTHAAAWLPKMDFNFSFFKL